MQQPISMVRGTTKSIDISVSSAVGSEYVLGDNDILRFGVKKSPDHRVCVIEKELTRANYNDDVYVLLITPDDTEGLDCGVYYYDVGLQVGSSYFNVIECSKFEIRQNITSRKTGADS